METIEILEPDPTGKPLTCPSVDCFRYFRNVSNDCMALSTHLKSKLNFKVERCKALYVFLKMRFSNLILNQVYESPNSTDDSGKNARQQFDPAFQPRTCK